MSSSIPVRKAKITLTDYLYRQDIENRILLAQLSLFELTVLQEIIHHSLVISIEQLAKDLETTVNHLLPILEKLSVTKLFKRQQSKLMVDKEVRKYFEFQLEKFDENFQPDLNFLQNVLNQIPIHILPIWYAIPRSSDNIFESIVNKYLFTPKVYRQYLNELQLDNPILTAIIQDVYHAPHFKISANELMAKYDLTRECFEEYILLLEYHFVCCLSYTRAEDCWQEVVTFFAEWLEYLQFEVQNKATPLPGPVESTYYAEFNFIKDLSILLQACQNKKIFPQEVKTLKAYTFDQPQLIIQTLVQKLIQIGFAKQSADGQLIATEKGKIWLAKSIPIQVSNLAIEPLNTLATAADFGSLCDMRNLYLIEKSLRCLVAHEWVDFDSFFPGIIIAIGDKEPVSLKNKGKKWKYTIPTYTPMEKQFIQLVIMERLAELGVVATGFYQGKACFCLTSFGAQFIH